MPTSPNHIILPAIPADEPFLWEMLYHAIHVPAGATPPPRDIVNDADLFRYVRGWGREHDSGVIALDSTDQRPIGAAWVRLLSGEDRGYGHVDDATPELTVAVLPEFRNRRVGTALLSYLLREIEERYPAVSLSVSPENPAIHLYHRLGFVVVGTCGTSVTMKRTMRT